MLVRREDEALNPLLKRLDNVMAQLDDNRQIIDELNGTGPLRQLHEGRLARICDIQLGSRSESGTTDDSVGQCKN